MHDTTSDVFVTGDDLQAKERVLRTFRPLPFRFLDAGQLRNNRTIERMTVLARELAVRYDHITRWYRIVYGVHKTPTIRMGATIQTEGGL